MITTWKFYSENTPLWEDMLETCKSATMSIDLEQFIFVNDEIGKRFLDVCTQKVREGVRVRLLWDDAGSWNLLGALLMADLSKRGIQVAFFNTIIPRSLDNHRWWFFRNHRRSLVVDSRIAFTGSFSIWKYTENWQELSLRIEGSVVKQIEQAFEKMWARAHNIRTDWGIEPQANHEGFSYVTNAPVPKKQFLYHALIEAIRNAESYIYLLTPYFVPDRRLIRVIRLAARRGVDIRLIIPASSDHPVVDIGARSFFSSLMKSGVSIYVTPPPLIHSKAVVIDGYWATIGTMNLDHVSLLYNFEANIVSTNKEFASEIHAYCLEKMRAAVEVNRDEWEKRSFAEKWLEFCTRFIRPFL